VNLVSYLGDGSIYVRTFEKGVERETLSCGTGAVASVVAFSLYKNHPVNKVKTKGGVLKVLFKRNKLYKFSDIYLIGQPTEEYSGEILF
jgi:diaminopimelate epimerase